VDKAIRVLKKLLGKKKQPAERQPQASAAGQ
jgi:hypothetical protein